jgi:hypothetical protein
LEPPAIIAQKIPAEAAVKAAKVEVGKEKATGVDRAEVDREEKVAVVVEAINEVFKTIKKGSAIIASQFCLTQIMFSDRLKQNLMTSISLSDNIRLAS